MAIIGLGILGGMWALCALLGLLVILSDVNDRAEAREVL